MPSLSQEALGQLFSEARTHNGWTAEPVSDDTLRALYELMKWGPTSANCSPARLVFLRTPEAKARLLPALMEGNREKTRLAPATAIIAMDMEFYEQLPKLFPHTDARSWFAGKPAAIQETAFRNSSLQGGYFIMAARALGLDCGPMSGYDAEAVNREFFPSGKVKANFICNLGHGDPAKLFARSPRLAFAEACQML